MYTMHFVIQFLLLLCYWNKVIFLLCALFLFFPTPLPPLSLHHPAPLPPLRPPADSAAYLIGINRIINAVSVIRSSTPPLLIQIREIKLHYVAAGFQRHKANAFSSCGLCGCLRVSIFIKHPAAVSARLVPPDNCWLLTCR